MRYPLIGICILCAALAADKKLPFDQTSNELVELSASLLSHDEIVKEFGSDLGGSIIVVRATVRPLVDTPYRIDHEDFVLLSNNDGQRSRPYEPSQIAGGGALIITQSGVRNAGVMGQPRWGGIGGMSGGSMGNAQTQTHAETTVKEDEKGKDSTPVLKALKEKILPEKETTDTTAGLLYFEIDGKVKTKDLELRYKTPAGWLAMRFRP